MSHFRKIDVRIWNDAKFQSLADEGKLIFFLLLTHPNMTALGAMRCSLDGLLAELEGNRDALADAFRDSHRQRHGGIRSGSPDDRPAELHKIQPSDVLQTRSRRGPTNSSICLNAT